jgi:hypothetical protein
MSSLLSLRVWVHITFCRADLRFFLYYHFKTCFKRLLNNILTRQILRRISYWIIYWPDKFWEEYTE